MLTPGIMVALLLLLLLLPTIFQLTLLFIALQTEFGCSLFGLCTTSSSASLTVRIRQKDVVIETVDVGGGGKEGGTTVG